MNNRRNQQTFFFWFKTACPTDLVPEAEALLVHVTDATFKGTWVCFAQSLTIIELISELEIRKISSYSPPSGE